MASALDKPTYIERAATGREQLDRAFSARQRSSAPIPFNEVMSRLVGRQWLLTAIEAALEPTVLVALLFTATLIVHRQIGSAHVLLAIVIFGLTYPGHSYLDRPPLGIANQIVGNWLVLSGILGLLGCLTGALFYFDRKLLLMWWGAVPLSQFGAQYLLRLLKPWIGRLQGAPKRAVVVGVNEQSIELARRLATGQYARLVVVGFFDDRATPAFDDRLACPVVGKLGDLPRFANDNSIDVIYLSMPMHSQPRVLSLLDELRDTTASIYYVPDLIVTELIQGRMASVEGLPVVGVCETPFTGLDGLIKRASDVAFSLMVLLPLAPLLLFVALGVKLSSQGPAIFKQRRYGLDGKCIVVYKFRTMTVTEDGDSIKQASKGDARVTRFGAFLRKTSLDELPQFINVLQGRMSVVGPRPHAIAHNEIYRKLIKGYMLRHKAKPGITGWAQVNGLRGETETLDKMRLRIDYDLDYLRHWSVRFDSYIIARTLVSVLNDQRKTAY